ncbi:heme ABC exporter ATP-binding protein CcmA [Fuchsiella alkaliacetigena]|uniref:heme ABC exporter ATP-binding protein CcmA n=1 Tax=Fuchsiella alkaliacetigena TaxID=957042 RepID=UPI00200B7A68|nr:heme ABC exporter ATP-binding protein CcmA [Fuchsiella alkaliacetigena]MCK8825182.1 heme ABC exporter ATP-binding protein CcmA [Fuchsiella alkaliacetigena]
MSETPVLAVKDLSKQIGEKNILNGINFSLEQGQVLSIFGPNGAGKTTLLKILSTVIDSSEGEVLFEGRIKEKKAVDISKDIGVISHSTFLYDDLTAYENLEFYGQLYEVEDLKERIFTVIEKVGLSFCVHDLVRTFSRGMKQRLSIARAILHLPQLLLLDEPYTGLDQHAVEMLNVLLSNLAMAQRTVVMVTHNFEQGLKLSDKFLILVEGSIVFAGASEDFSLAELQTKYKELLGD